MEVVLSWLSGLFLFGLGIFIKEAKKLTVIQIGGFKKLRLR